MTLDEARQCLGVTAAASVEDVRDAFRRRAREVHPDLHIGSAPADRAALNREFDRARQARDILARYTSDPLRKTPRSAGVRPERPAQPHPSQGRHASQSSPPRRPERVTMRFEEFIVWTDAAGFGKGTRTRRYIDWARIVAWTVVTAAIAGVIGGIIVYSSSVI